MIYVLYGIEDFLIKQKLNKIIQENQINDLDINYYDLEESNLKSIIDDASTFSLFSSKRMIVVENSYIFTSTSKKEDTKVLENYINNPNLENILVFLVYSEKLDNRKKIVSYMKEKAKVIEFNEVANYSSLVKELLVPYSMSDSNISFLLDRVGLQLYNLKNEIDKLKIYKETDYEITKQDILDLTVKNIDVNIFHLIDNIILKNKERAIESYFEMIKLGEEPIKIIVMLANQFRLMYQVKILKKQGISVFEMMSILGQKKFPIEKAMEKGKSSSETDLLGILKQLSKLDLDIKTGNIDKNIGLELFILGYDLNKSKKTC